MNEKYNKGIDFDECKPLLDATPTFNLSCTKALVTNLLTRRERDKENEIAALLRAITCIDLTTLCGDDTECNTQRLCHKAANPISENVLKLLGMDVLKNFHVAAVCVYPTRVQECSRVLKSLNSRVSVASVAAGFPSGQYPLNSKEREVDFCVQNGANEIDIVISRELVLQGQWKMLYDEVKALRYACGDDVHLKTIIAAGELGSLEKIYKASMVAMAAGSDFIKTSTGKEAVNATLPIGVIMARAIKEYYNETGFLVGFKPAGGIRNCQDVLNWQFLMEYELGKKWLYPDLFRIGASGLLGDIEKKLYQYATGCTPSKSTFAYQ